MTERDGAIKAHLASGGTPADAEALLTKYGHSAWEESFKSFNGCYPKDHVGYAITNYDDGARVALNPAHASHKTNNYGVAAPANGR